MKLKKSTNRTRRYHRPPRHIHAESSTAFRHDLKDEIHKLTHGPITWTYRVKRRLGIENINREEWFLIGFAIFLAAVAILPFVFFFVTNWGIVQTDIIDQVLQAWNEREKLELELSEVSRSMLAMGQGTFAAVLAFLPFMLLEPCGRTREISLSFPRKDDSERRHVLICIRASLILVFIFSFVSHLFLVGCLYGIPSSLLITSVYSIGQSVFLVSLVLLGTHIRFGFQIGLLLIAPLSFFVAMTGLAPSEGPDSVPCVITHPDLLPIQNWAATYLFPQTWLNTSERLFSSGNSLAASLLLVPIALVIGSGVRCFLTRLSDADIELDEDAREIAKFISSSSRARRADSLASKEEYVPSTEASILKRIEEIDRQPETWWEEVLESLIPRFAWNRLIIKNVVFDSNLTGLRKLRSGIVNFPNVFKEEWQSDSQKDKIARASKPTWHRVLLRIHDCVFLTVGLALAITFLFALVVLLAAILIGGPILFFMACFESSTSQGSQSLAVIGCAILMALPTLGTCHLFAEHFRQGLHPQGVRQLGKTVVKVWLRNLAIVAPVYIAFNIALLLFYDFNAQEKLLFVMRSFVVGVVAVPIVVQLQFSFNKVTSVPIFLSRMGIALAIAVLCMMVLFPGPSFENYRYSWGEGFEFLFTNYHLIAVALLVPAVGFNFVSFVSAYEEGKYDLE